MPIKCKTPREEIASAVEEGFDRFLFAVQREVAFAGEVGVNAAREVNSTNSPRGYTDRTGNLRSSITYKAAMDGVIFAGGDMAPVLQGDEGKRKGDELAEKEAKTYEGDNITLVMVAGMDYASHVQDRYDKDVLDTGFLRAQQELEHGLKNL